MTKQEFIKLLQDFDDDLEVAFYNSATDSTQRVITGADIEESDGKTEIVIEVK